MLCIVVRLLFAVALEVVVALPLLRIVGGGTGRRCLCWCVSLVSSMVACAPFQDLVGGGW